MLSLMSPLRSGVGRQIVYNRQVSKISLILVDNKKITKFSHPLNPFNPAIRDYPVSSQRRKRIISAHKPRYKPY